MNSTSNGQRILVCAFTCCPPGKPGFTGGEDVLGWSLLLQIARFHEVWALTHAEDRPSLEEALAEKSISNIHFQYVGLPGWLKPLLKIQGGHQFYYYLWQVRAFFTAWRLQGKVHFDIFHHVTYANDWMVSFIGALLSIPYIRGPGGGAHRTPKELQQEYTLKGRLWEKGRSKGQWLFRHDPLYIRGQSRARAILLCNWDSISKIPEKWASKSHLFPVSGISSEDLGLASFDQTTGDQTTGDQTNGHSKEQASEPAQPGQFQVLTTGSLIRIKGFGLGIKAFKEFSDQYPESTFTIVGDGPERPHLLALIQRLNLEERVRLLPAIPRGELLQKMASSDVILFPSMRDGGGTVVIEAMSVGKPVVCLDIGGPGMHITEECGIKITPSSPEATVHDLAGALARLYLDPNLRTRLGKAAHKRATQAYHWDRLGERLLEIYNSETTVSTAFDRA